MSDDSSVPDAHAAYSSTSSSMPFVCCPWCRGLYPAQEGLRRESQGWVCSICNQVVCPPVERHDLPTALATAHAVEPYPQEAHFFDYPSWIWQSRTPQHWIPHPQEPTANLNDLMRLMERATRFIHIVTYGVIGHRLFFHLGGIASHIPTYVVVAHTHSYKREEQLSLAAYTPHLNLRVVGGKQSNNRVPHQKVVVIDGRLAIFGSANLTDTGWRRAAHGREIIQCATRVDEVAAINNRYFAPVWAEYR